MEVLLSYNVGLSSVSVSRDPSGSYHYLVSDIDPEKYEAVARLVGKALELVDPRRSVGIYEVTKALLSRLRGYDPELVSYVVSRELKYKKLQVLIDDPYVEDISVVGPGPVWVRHKYVLERDPSADYIETNIVISSHEELLSYMELVAERSGRVVNRRSPVMDFTLPEEDGGHRVHLVLPDVAHPTGELVIRKKVHHGSVDLESLVKTGMVPEPVAELIKLVVRRGGSIVVLGPPGSGKTTLLKAVLYSVIPRHWKIAIIEDTPEVDVPKGASWVRYTVPTDVWGSGRGIDQMALAKAALRASVSRFIVIGETRGAEAKVLTQAMNMGLGGLCLPGDQLVLARVDGRVDLYEVREIVEGVARGDYARVEVVAPGPDLEPTWQPISAAVAKRGTSRFVRIEVDGGATHEVHEDHIVVVTGGASGLAFKRARELVPGDELVAFSRPPRAVRGREFVELPEGVLEGAEASEDPVPGGGPRGSSLRLRLGRSLGYLVGVYLAAGSLVEDSPGSPAGVRLDVGADTKDRLLSLLEDAGLGACEVEVFGAQSGSAVRILVRSRALALLLSRLAGGSADAKRVPLDVVLESSGEFGAGLVEGYRDGSGSSGSADSAGIRMRAQSRKLAESLALILKTLGAQPSVRALGPDSGSGYEVAVERGSVERLSASASLADPGKEGGGLVVLRVRRVEVVDRESLLYDVEVPGAHLYAISGSLILTHNTTFHAGSPEEAIVRLTSPPIELAPQQLAMIWLFVTLGFLEGEGLKRVVARVDEPVLKSNTLVLNTIYRYGEEADLETLLKRFARARDLWV